MNYNIKRDKFTLHYINKTNKDHQEYFNPLIEYIMQHVPQQPTSTEFEQAQQPKINNQPPQLADPTNTLSKSGSKLNANFYQRTWTTIYMILGFLIVLSAGHFYCALFIVFCNSVIFSELNSIKRNEQKQQNIPLTKYINWYIFAAVNYYSLGNFIAGKIPIIGFWYPVVGQLLTYHGFICFMLMIVGFLAFVLSLKQGYLKYQFRLFGWIVIATLLVSMQGWLMIHNLFQGLIWFIIPAFLIVSNDIFAYLVGYFFGKHQLIALSPKKTWQGYIGGAIFTLLFSLILTSSLQSIPGLTCKVLEPTLVPFAYPTCTSYLDQIYVGLIAQYLPFQITTLQAHVLILSLFASIIGPFGGFFASGLKRAIKIKDFANSIPGHGGVSDRMDCQIIMGAFTYFYIHSFVRTSFTENIAFLLTSLSSAQRLSLYEALRSNLKENGMIEN